MVAAVYVCEWWVGGWWWWWGRCACVCVHVSVNGRVVTACLLGEWVVVAACVVAVCVGGG